jgi:outer membrane protein TolC
MRRLLVFVRWYACATTVALLGLTAGTASAQGTGGATQPAPIPLSGRSTAGGSVTAVESPLAGVTGSISTVNPIIQVQGKSPLEGPLSLQEALRRGLEYNLGALNLAASVGQARGQRLLARSALLPNIVGDLTGTRQEINLAALGLGTQFTSPIPGFTFPTVVGPFNQIDIRARLSLNVYDRTAWNNFQAASEVLRADQLTVEDAHDLVVLGVAGTYLQAVAARARVAAGKAQLDTANALLRQTQERRAVGLVAQVDVGRSQVQALTAQQRLTTLQVDFAKQKINLARMVGLPPTDQYEIGDDIPFASAPALALEAALKEAQATRADLKAAEAQLRAAERGQAAARGERLPSVTLNADYGAIGNTVAQAQRTFAITGRLRVPIWQGGSADAAIQQAEAAVRQRRGELDDLGSQIEGEVRKGFLEMEAAANQVDVAVRNQEVAQQTLDLTRQRFDAGITDNVEVVQAQEAAAIAALDYINSVFAHNLAKLGLSRAIGVAAERLQDFLRVP